MFQGLRTIVYRVADLAAARQWYHETTGEAPYFDEPFYVGFNIGGYELGLVPAEDLAPGSTTYWGVENADQAFQALLERGARSHEEVHDVGGGIRVASLIDPAGNLLGIIENPHFKLADP